MLFFSLLTILLFVQCNPEEGTDNPLPAISCEDGDCLLPPRNADFGFDLFRELHGEAPTNNLFISPFSVSTALAMTTNGAAGQTQADMLAALRFQGLTLDEINPEFKDLLHYLPNLDPEVAFLPANAIWYRQGFEVRPPFLDTNAQYYGAQVSDLDFDDPQSVAIINNWVNENTNGLIPTIIEQIPAEAVMYLMNAVYFKGAWLREFDPDNTTAGPFFLADGSTEEVAMMSYGGKVALPYLETETFQAVDLAYGDSVFSMTILLPKETAGLNDLIADLSLDNWNQWTGNLVSQEVIFAMPKFELTYEASLGTALTNLGMGVAFTRQADFSNINPTAPLQISDVRHKAFVEVNEEGTEAAAVTSVEIVVTSVDPTPAMMVNRPFLFVIRDNRTGSVLFMGKVVNPNT